MAVSSSLDLAALSGLTQEVYNPGLHDQILSKGVLPMLIKKTSKGVSSIGAKGASFGVRVARNHGIGGRNEKEALPVAGHNNYLTGNVPLRYLYGSAQLTGQVFEEATTNEQVFADAVEQEMQGLMDSLGIDLSRQMYGTSTGKLATSNAAGTTTTFVCSNAEAIYLEPDMFVDVYTSAPALRGSNLTISSIDIDTPTSGTTTVTFSTALGTATASGDYLTRTSSSGKEIDGLAHIVTNSGTVHNINSATYPVWKSIVSSSSTNRPLSEQLVIQTIDRMRRTSGKIPNKLVTNLGVRLQYFILLEQAATFVSRDMTGGFESLSFTYGGTKIPIVEDIHCPWNTIYILNTDAFRMYMTHDFKFMTRGKNGVWTQFIDTTGAYDAYVAYVSSYMNLGTIARNRHGVITQISQSTY